MSVQPSTTWSFSLGQASVVPNNINVGTYRWFPDAHIAVLKDVDDQAANATGYIMFWSEFENYRSVGGPTPYPEDQQVLDPQQSIFGGRYDAEGYNNGGSWLNSVFRQSDITASIKKNKNKNKKQMQKKKKNKHKKNKALIGFYHAEDHWYPRNPRGVAWKSMGVATSPDNGYTWQAQGPIITSSKPKPTTPAWGGAGDGVVIWNEVDQRWICYFADHFINMAMSVDPAGAPGSK
jgi:hypothetical protein